MANINTKNKISVFASNAVISSTDKKESGQGYVYDDNTWAGINQRVNGVYEGIASSQTYNTAIRQATTMASVLADAISIRNGANSAYSYESTYGIGTAFHASESTLEKHVNNLAQVFANKKFLFDSEVITSKIADSAVTTVKIANNNVTHAKLGEILNNSSGLTKTANNMTVKLSQTNGKGPLVLSFTGDIVTNSTNVRLKGTSTSKIYLWGYTSTSEQNCQPLTHGSVYMTNGTLYSSALSTGSISSSSTITASSYIKSSSYVEAPYFNATSDARLKSGISGLNRDDVIKFVENTNLCRFVYKEKPNEPCIGIIAQDVEDRIINDFNITSKNEDGILTIKENKLVYILWEYIKILRDRNRLY